MHLISQRRKSEKSVDLSKVDSIRCEQDAKAYYIFFFRYVDFGDRAGSCLIDSWTYENPLERDIDFRKIRRLFLGGKIEFIEN